MSNEILWFVMLLVNFCCIALAYRILGRVGLYVWIPLSVILANVQVLKTVELFGLVCTLGNILYAGSFLATDILSENYGKKAAGKGVVIGFFSLVAMTLIMQLAVAFTPHESDFSQEALKTLFGIMPRVAGASLLAYVVSQLHDVWAYEWWRTRFPAFRWIWLRNNASTMVSQLLDTLIFTLTAFLGVFPKEILVEIFLTTYFLKWLVAALDTPFLYLAGRLYQKGKIREI